MIMWYSSTDQPNHAHDPLTCSVEGAGLDTTQSTKRTSTIGGLGKPDLLETQLKQLQESTPVAINGSHTYKSCNQRQSRKRFFVPGYLVTAEG